MTYASLSSKPVRYVTLDHPAARVNHLPSIGCGYLCSRMCMQEILSKTEALPRCLTASKILGKLHCQDKQCAAG